MNRRAEMQSRGPSRSSYGQACMSCFRCKSKCVARPDGHGCERCHRLNKQCQPADAIRRRALGRRQNPSSRIAELEGKLDGLVSLLQSRNVLDRSVAAQPDDAIGSGGAAHGGVHDAEETGGDDDGGNTTRPSEASTSPLPSPAVGVDFAESTAGESLDIFRSSMLLYMPFVHLPADVTAEQLRRKRPTLFKAIMCVTSLSAPGNRERARELKRVFCELSFLRQPDNQPGSSDRTMDLLLALLVYISWGWDHVVNRCTLSRLMVLAVSLVGELHLDKPIPKDALAFRLSTPGLGGYADTNADAATRTLEQHRALLGCFLLSCVVSAYFGDVDALRWTPQMDGALEALSAQEHCPADAVLVLEVRMQLLAVKAAQIQYSQRLNETQKILQMTSLLEQLQELRPSTASGDSTSGLPSTNRRCPALLHAYRHYIKIDMIATMTSSVTQDSTIDSLSYFRQSVVAIDACTSVLLTFTPSEFLGISFLQWVQLSRCTVVLHHLNSLRDPNWDHAAVRAIVDLSVLLDRVAEKLELAARQAAETNGVFAQLNGAIRLFKSTVQDYDMQPGHGRPDKSETNLVRQTGYFRNPRFWMEAYFGRPSDS